MDIKNRQEKIVSYKVKNCKDDCANYSNCDYAQECTCVDCCVMFVPVKKEE